LQTVDPEKKKRKEELKEGEAQYLSSEKHCDWECSAE
jgi:hypothetical protein